jgi:hypothetical protein
MISIQARSAVVSAAGIAMLGLSGCLMVGYSSGGGWIVWPGGLGLVVFVLLIIFLMRRR